MRIGGRTAHIQQLESIKYKNSAFTVFYADSFQTRLVINEWNKIHLKKFELLIKLES